MESRWGRRGEGRGWKRLRPPRPIHLSDRVGVGLVWTPGYLRAHTQEALGPRGCFLECFPRTGQARARPRLLLHIPGEAACPGWEMGSGKVGCEEGRARDQECRSPAASSLRPGVLGLRCLVPWSPDPLPPPSEARVQAPESLLPETREFWSSGPLLPRHQKHGLPEDSG